jgi:hypothetical protein
VELGVDWRANEPILMAVGPVLHPDDAVANKMSPLYGRAFARDFIDIDATLQSGRHTREAVLRPAFANTLIENGLIDPAMVAARVETLEVDPRVVVRLRRWIGMYAPQSDERRCITTRSTVRTGSPARALDGVRSGSRHGGAICGVSPRRSGRA